MNNEVQNNVDSLINNLSKTNYSFDANILSKEEIKHLKKQAKDARGLYGLNTPIGTNIFSFIEQNNLFISSISFNKNILI